MDDRERLLRQLNRQQRELNRRFAVRMVMWVAILAAMLAGIAALRL